MKTVATIQVRMGSTRLPGKVMRDLLGEPVLGRLINRAQKAKQLDEIVVITSVNPNDDIIYEYCKNNSIEVFRGSEDNVLSRILFALQYYDAEIGVTLFGDCPCVDPQIIDSMVSIYKKNVGVYDYVGNDLKTTYPPGLEVGVYSVSALEDAYKKTCEHGIIEHGTLFIRQNPTIYKLLNVEAPEELFYPELEIELDSEEDFKVIEEIYKYFFTKGKIFFTAQDVVNFMLNNPKLQEINRNINRRWKEFRKN